MAVAALLWILERARRRTFASSLRSWQLPLAAYLGITCISALLATPGRGTSWATVLVMLELAVVAVLTADFSATPQRRHYIARVIVGSALVTLMLAIVGEVLFYVGLHTGLLGDYGNALTPSHLYARIQAGFESAPLLGSFCIFASGVVASEDAALNRGWRLLGQVGLFVLCLTSISRAVVGFLVAALLRNVGVLGPRRGRIVGTVGVAVGAASLMALTVGQLHLDPVHPASSSYLIPSPGYRLEALTSSWRTFLQHPLIGIGPGALPGANPNPLRAHFTPVNVMATVGLPAFVALCLMVWMIWRRRARPTDVPLWSALLGMGLDGLTSDIDHYRHVWLLLGLLGRPRSKAACLPEDY